MAFAVLLIIIVFAGGYLFFLPKVSTKFWYNLPGVPFPLGCEEIIDPLQCSDPFSKILLKDKEHLEGAMTAYEGVIRAAIFRQHFKRVCSYKCVQISRLTTVIRDKGIYILEVSTKGYLNWFNPKGKEKVRKELTDIENALRTVRLSTMIYSFEIDEDTWKSRGPAFLDSISGRNLNNLDEIMIKLLSQFNPKTLGEIGT